MRKRRFALLLLAASLWLTAVIACRASFSPDGSRVLFPFIDKERKQSAIGLYDLRSGKTEVVFSVSIAGREDGFILAPAWTPDGRRAVVVALDGSKRLGVHLLPLESRTPSRLFVIKEEKDQAAALISPPPLVGGRYLLLGGTSLKRLDLGTGEVLVSDLESETILVGQDDVVYYLRETPGGRRGREVGKLEHEGAWESPRLAPILTFGDQAGELGRFLAVDREGARFALSAEKEDQPAVVIASVREPLRRIGLGSRADAGWPGNLLWSSDGRRIYAAYAREAPEKKLQFGACEVPLEGGDVRRIPLFSMAIGSAERELYLFQIALSPDGKTLAASSALLDPEKLEPEDRALWLIDLAGPERKTTRVALPSPPAGPETGK